MSALTRRAAAELVGTAYLVMAVIGSGIAATRLSPHQVGLQLLENSLVTGAALVALILALHPVSAAFNPVVTLVERSLGAVSTVEAATLVGAQVLGGLIGAMVANLMFGLEAVSVASRERTGGGLLLGELVATLGLVLIIFGSLRSEGSHTVAYAVGAWITAAYWFTSSTSFANPAVTVARTLSDTFAGIAPASVPLFVLMQLVGGALAAVLVRVLYPPPVSPAGPRARGVLMNDRPTVLFVCVHNAGRSQMAAAYLEHLAGDRIQVLSAGSEPGERVNPVAVAAMREEGIDLTGARPKVLTAGTVEASDVVVTMGCGDACPYFPGRRYVDWALDDPAGQGLEAVRTIRDEIRRRVEHLVEDLVGDGSRTGPATPRA